MGGLAPETKMKAPVRPTQLWLLPGTTPVGYGIGLSLDWLLSFDIAMHAHLLYTLSR